MSRRCEDFFALRTPLLPFDDFLAWSGRAVEPGDDENARRRLREDLARRLDQPEAREALFVASPSLAAVVDSWREHPHSKQGRQIERALVRYFSRMTSRPTPFGLCSGISAGTLGSETRLRLAPRDRYTRAIALDGALVARLRDASARLGTLGPNAPLSVNSSLFSHDGRLRYIEARTVGGRRQLSLAEVESTPYIEWMLDGAREQARVHELIARLRHHDPEITEDEATEFVEGLVEHQLLCRADGLRVTGPAGLEGSIEELAGGGAEPADRERLAALERVREEIAALEQQPLGVASSRYQALCEPVEALATPSSSGSVLKIDLHKPLLEGTLDASVRDELVEAARVLARLCDEPADPLLGFRAQFRRRYQERWVPLLEALDPDVGIGFDPWGTTTSLRTPLLDGLPFATARDDRMTWRPKKHRWLLERLLERAKEGREALVLGDADVEAMALRDDPRLPTAYHLIASLLPPDMPGGATVWLRSGGGPSGANLLGRFCHGSRALEQGVRQHLAREAELHAPAVVAEVVHLPDDRLLNVIGRPVLREHELVVLSRSGADAAKQIRLDDLWLRLHDQRVVLASRRLGKEVIVRLTSAHNHWSARNVGVYSFLCALQGQGTSTAFGWDWGPLADLPHLPRVRWRRIVLSPARWRLDAAELPRESAPPHERSAALARLRARHELPRLVLLVQDDQELLVDLDNPLSVDSLLHAAETATRPVLLRELLEHQGSPVRGPEGGFVHELVIPVDGELAPRPAVDTSRIGADAEVQRVFPPRDQWRSWRLYAAPGLVERALVDDVLPWLEQSAAPERGIEWYFLRDGDPHWHLCLRLRGADDRAVDALEAELAALGRALVSRGRLWSIRADTYVRELERYGGPQGIAACERIFAADSRLCAVAIAAVAHAEDEALRWTIALWSIDRMLAALELDEAERLEIVEILRHNFGDELGANGGPLEHALGRRYRALRAEVDALLDPEAGVLDPALRQADERFAAQVRPEVTHLRALDRAGTLPEPFTTIVRSLLHMRINRLMLEDARRHELVLYDLLARTQRSRIARRRRGNER